MKKIVINLWTSSTFPLCDSGGWLYYTDIMLWNRKNETKLNNMQSTKECVTNFKNSLENNTLFLEIFNAGHNENYTH